MNKDISSGQRETLISKHHLLRYVLSALFLIAVASFLTSCSHPYYATFSIRISEFDFTFEYPGGWQGSDLQQYPEIVFTSLFGTEAPDTVLPDGTTKKGARLILGLDVFPGLGEKAEKEAEDKFNSWISAAKTYRNFTLLKQDSINLDGYDGYQAEYTYIQSTIIPPGFEYTAKELVIEIPRKGRVYQIKIMSSEDELNARENDIQHVLSTFKWK